MTDIFESTTRGPVDCLHFAIIFFAVIGTAAGIVMVAPALTALGALAGGYGIVYFLVREWLEREG